MKRKVFALFFLMCVSSWVFAGNYYIKSNTEVAVRSGASNSYSVIDILQPGDVINVVRFDVKNGYSEIRLDDESETGYILSRFIEALNENESESQEDDAGDNSSEVSQLGNEEELDPKQKMRLLEEQNALYVGKLEQAEKKLEEFKFLELGGKGIIEKNQSLENEIQKLHLQLDEIRIINTNLKQKNDKDKWLVGGVLVILGLVLGFLLSISGRSRRRM